MSEQMNLLIGLAFVLFHSHQRFSTPVTNRCSTTAERFYAAMGLYCLLMGAAYGLVAQYPHLVGFVTHGGEVPEPGNPGSSAALHVALLFTVLLPRIPILKQLDQALLKFTQDLANIPVGIRSLCDTLRRARPHITPEQQALVDQEAHRLGLDTAPAVAMRGHPLLERWKETAALFLSVDQWESDPRMGGFAELFKQDWQTIREQYEEVSGKIKEALTMLGSPTSVGSREGHEFTGRFQKLAVRFQEDCAALLEMLRREMITYVGRGVFHSEPTSSSRSKRLASLGFTLPMPRKGLNANQITFLIAAIAFLFVASKVVFAAPGVAMEDVFVMSILIALKNGLAIACVVLPKSWWNWARHTPGTTRPWMFYIGASLAAVALSLVLSLMMGAWMARDWAAGAERFFAGRYPWLLMTFGTALATAVLVDTPLLPRLGRRQRWLEGLGLALVFIFTGWMTHQWLLSTQSAPADLAGLMGRMGLIGFIIGATVPAWYRDAADTRRRRWIEASPDEEEALLPTPAHGSAG